MSTFLDVATGDDYILYQHAVVEINVELTDTERTGRGVNRTISQEEETKFHFNLDNFRYYGDHLLRIEERSSLV